MSWWNAKGRFPGVGINAQALKQEIQRILLEAGKEAGREYLRTFVEIVPSYSGASRAQLIPLAQIVGANVPITVVSDENRTAQGKSAGGAELVVSEDKMTLTITTALPWFNVNEDYDARSWGIHLKQPGPYNARPAAEAAGEIVLERAAAEIKSKVATAVAQSRRKK